jgi:fimbrial chaperone protein
MKPGAAALLAVAALLAPARSRAANVEVSPVRIELGPGKPSAVLVVRNEDKDAVRFQLKAHAWGQAPDGEMLLSEASELQVFPALFQLAPGEERKVRIGTTAKPGTLERTWRVFVEELPSAVERREKTSVRVLTRIGIPIFLAPTRVEGRAELALAASGSKLELRIRNTGTVRREPSKVTLRLEGAAGERLDEKELGSWYVLAGGERVLAAEIEKAVCGKVVRAVATMPAEPREVQASLQIPSGACGP